MWVGFSGALVEPLGVRLTAFNAASGVVGTDDATLPAEREPTPMQTQLEGRRAAGPERQVKVSVTTGGGCTAAGG